MKRKVLSILTIVFIILSFAGAGYVLYTKGEANAGYGVIPSVCALLCFLANITVKKK